LKKCLQLSYVFPLSLSHKQNRINANLRTRSTLRLEVVVAAAAAEVVAAIEWQGAQSRPEMRTDRVCGFGWRLARGVVRVG